MPPKRAAAKQSSRIAAMKTGDTRGAKRSREEEPTTSTQQPAKRIKPVSAPVPLRATPLNAPPKDRLEVFSFGGGASGELGLGPKVNEVTRPRLNPNFDANTVGIVSLAMGGMHGVALTHDNKILTWGVNDELALGRDTTWEGGLRDIEEDSDSDDIELNPHESTPARVPANKFPRGTTFVQVVAADNSSFVLTDDGRVYGWGTFRDGSGGRSFSIDSDGQIIQKSASPMLIPNLTNITHLSAGPNYVLALSSQGHVFSWGINDKHQLGHRLRAGSSPLLPSDIGLGSIVSVHAASNHAFAINKNDHVYAWGSNNFGQTGISVGAGEDNAVIFPPRRVKGLSKRGITTIQGGNKHSIGLTAGGECLVWGCMDGFQMGLDLKTIPDGDPRVVWDDRGKPRVLAEPTAVPIPRCVCVAAGVDHNIAITEEGKAYSWGFNEGGRCGQGPHDDDVVVATLIDNTAVRNKKLAWAGAGGQYSMMAAVYSSCGTNSTTCLIESGGKMP